MERLLIHDALNDKDLTHTDKNTAYVLLSKGKTGKCYFDTKNNTINKTLPDDATINNCVQSNSNPDYRVNTSVDRKIYQGYNKTAFDNLVRYKTISALMQTNSNIKDKIRSSTIYNHQQYVERNSIILNTNSKNIVEAINELKDDIDALQYGTLAPRTSNGANVGLTNVDGSLVKNIALWKPGKYKFDNDAVITNYYSTQLPKATDGNYYAGELNIYDISTTSKNPLNTQWQYRLYEYMSYNGHKWIAKVNAGDISGHLFSNDMQIPWQSPTCEANWPVGSIYISTSLSTADAVRNKLGCGEWISVNKDKVLWSVTSNANNLLTACVPEVAGWFHANKELDFTANGNLFSVAQSNGNFALGNNSNSSTYCKITANFSAYNSIWGACGAGVNTIRPTSVAVYMWKRCDGDCRVIIEPSLPNSSASTTTLYCPTNNPSTDTGCSTAVPTADNYYKCTFVAGNRSGDCTEQKATKYCPTNNPSTDSGCATQVSATNHYKCTFVVGTRTGNCTDMQETKYCSTNTADATCISTPENYSCTIVDGKIVGGTCTARTYKYCTNSNATTCANTPINTSYTYYCTFYGSTKNSCETKSVEYKYCTGEGIGCATNIASTSQYHCSFINGAKVSCTGSTTSNCNNNSLGASCAGGNSYSCTIVNSKIASCNENSVSTETAYCDNNKVGQTCDRSSGEYCNYTCNLVGGIIQTCTRNYCGGAT